jgi:hypothetical protein
MRSVLRVLLFSACTSALLAQTAAPGGMSPEWDIRVILQEMAAHAGRLLPVFDKIDVKSWGGASETYAEQLQSAKDQTRAIAAEARELARRPDKLSAALQLHFRLNGLDNIVHSLGEGIRKYQNPAVAGMLMSLSAENGANRDRFQRYVVDLAAEREEQFIVMDKEAQRCRGFLAGQPVAKPTGRKK